MSVHFQTISILNAIDFAFLKADIPFLVHLIEKYELYLVKKSVQTYFLKKLNDSAKDKSYKDVFSAFSKTTFKKNYQQLANAQKKLSLLQEGLRLHSSKDDAKLKKKELIDIGSLFIEKKYQPILNIINTTPAIFLSFLIINRKTLKKKTRYIDHLLSFIIKKIDLKLSVNQIILQKLIKIRDSKKVFKDLHTIEFLIQKLPIFMVLFILKKRLLRKRHKKQIKIILQRAQEEHCSNLIFFILKYDFLRKFSARSKVLVITKFSTLFPHAILQFLSFKSFRNLTRANKRKICFFVTRLDQALLNFGLKELRTFC